MASKTSGVAKLTDLIASVKSDIARTKQFAFDLECHPPTGGRPSDAKDPKLAVPFLFVIASGKNSHALDINSPEVAAFIKELFSDPELEAICHNAGYDIIVLHRHHFIDATVIKAKLRDTMVCQFILDEERPFGLKDMALLHLKHKMVTYDEATADNDLAREKAKLEAEIDERKHSLKNFHKKRPYPAFDSQSTVTPAQMKESLQRAIHKRWPATDAAGNPSPLTTSDKEAKKKFKDNGLNKIDHFFSEEERNKYEAWITDEFIAKRSLRIAELEAALTAVMKTYSEDDARQTLKLWNKLSKKITDQGLLGWLRLECEVRRVVVAMSATGIPADIKVYEALDTLSQPLLVEMLGEIHNQVKQVNDDGSPLNPDSPDQLKRAVFGVLQCEIPANKRLPNGQLLPKLTKAGEQYVQQNNIHLDLRNAKSIPQEVRDKYLSCDSAVLERINHPIGMMILNYRTLAKLHTTYIKKGIELLRTSQDGRVYGYFNSIGAETGRLTSSDPNLQNIPSRSKGANYDKRISKLGPKIRDAFVALPGKSLIIVDQSQIELRIIADFTQDSNMLAIYNEAVEIAGIKFYTGDIHEMTAKHLGIDRKSAKGVNFGFNYGMGADKFARNMRMFDATGSYDFKLATQLRNGFFQTYPGILGYCDQLHNLWQEGLTEFTMKSGRKRHYSDGFVTGGAILNSKVQGTSADMMKIGMLMIDKFVRPVCPSLEMIIQVHDELGFQCDSGAEAAKASVLIKYVLEQAWFPLAVPVLASSKVCQSWAAKDDDSIPETGLFYAHIQGVGDKIFNETNWTEYLEYDKNKMVTTKSAVAVLSPKHLAYCRRIIPSTLPELA